MLCVRDVRLIDRVSIIEYINITELVRKLLMSDLHASFAFLSSPVKNL